MAQPVRKVLSVLMEQTAQPAHRVLSERTVLTVQTATRNGST
jgi:hypothetical protein